MRAAFGLLPLLLSAPALAQYPMGANALRWLGATSTAGPFCWGFACAPVPATVNPGESGTVFVRSEFGDAYVLALSLTATSCIAVPGLLNQLALDGPAVWQLGVCSTPSPILACPGGYFDLNTTIPAFLPPGFRFALQGITGAPSRYAFTQAIEFTVQ